MAESTWGGCSLIRTTSSRRADRSYRHAQPCVGLARAPAGRSEPSRCERARALRTRRWPAGAPAQTANSIVCHRPDLIRPDSGINRTCRWRASCGIAGSSGQAQRCRATCASIGTLVRRLELPRREAAAREGAANRQRASASARAGSRFWGVLCEPCMLARRCRKEPALIGRPK